MITILIIVAIYIISVVLAWNYIRVAHSKGGEWDYANPTKEDLIVMLVPIVNTLLSLDWIFAYPKERTKIRKKINYNKFFKIKK